MSIVRELDRCINCQSCIMACKRRHGVTRMTLEGTTIGCISLPNICRQCSEPACVDACPKQAMVKDGEKVHVIQEHCIGCGLCARACPYNAITMIEAEELERKGPILKMFRALFLRGGLEGKKEKKLETKMETKLETKLETKMETKKKKEKKMGTKMKKKLAVKCDLCFGYDSPTCIDSCPTRALHLRTLEEDTQQK